MEGALLMDGSIIVSHSASIRQREYAAISRWLMICLPLLRLNNLCMICLCPSDIDTADEFVVDIHLLRFNAIFPDFFFMYHNFLNQLIENMGR